MVRSQSSDRKSTRLNSSHTEIYTLSLHDALPIWPARPARRALGRGRTDASRFGRQTVQQRLDGPLPILRSEEHTSELQSHRDLHSFPTRRSSDLAGPASTASARTRPDRRFTIRPPDGPATA